MKSVCDDTSVRDKGVQVKPLGEIAPLDDNGNIVKIIEPSGSFISGKGRFRAGRDFQTPLEAKMLQRRPFQRTVTPVCELQSVAKTPTVIEGKISEVDLELPWKLRSFEVPEKSVEEKIRAVDLRLPWKLRSIEIPNKSEKKRNYYCRGSDRRLMEFGEASSPELLWSSRMLTSNEPEVILSPFIALGIPSPPYHPLNFDPTDPLGLKKELDE